MYNINSAVVAISLFGLILLANEVFYRLAIGSKRTEQEGVTTQTNTIQAGILGLLALLLGFSFNMALQRFDARSNVAIEETQAISSAWLKSSLLNGTDARETRRLLSEYVDLRTEAIRLDLTNNDSREQISADTRVIQGKLWKIVTDSAASESPPANIGLVVQAVSDVIASYGKRQAQLEKHVPQVVLYLLFFIFVVASSMLGHSAALAGGRPVLATLSMATLIVLVIFIVIDLDRPRRGFIQVDQGGMIELRRQFDNDLKEGRTP